MIDYQGSYHTKRKQDERTYIPLIYIFWKTSLLFIKASSSCCISVQQSQFPIPQNYPLQIELNHSKRGIVLVICSMSCLNMRLQSPPLMSFSEVIARSALQIISSLRSTS
ncbi:hypothetical protein Droror1_Dr00023585 [Drosera rotundifolia]